MKKILTTLKKTASWIATLALSGMFFTELAVAHPESQIS